MILIQLLSWEVGSLLTEILHRPEVGKRCFSNWLIEYLSLIAGTSLSSLEISILIPEPVKSLRMKLYRD